jgi:cell division protease FtsH
VRSQSGDQPQHRRFSAARRTENRDELAHVVLLGLDVLLTGLDLDRVVADKLARVSQLLGGRAAEQVLLSTMTAGASNDIERAVEIARKMVSEFGMSRLGPIHLGQSDQPHSQNLLDRIEEATNEIITEQLERACEVVTKETESINRLVELLMERDTLDAEEIAGCFPRNEARAA